MNICKNAGDILSGAAGRETYQPTSPPEEGSYMFLLNGTTLEPENKRNFNF